MQSAGPAVHVELDSAELTRPARLEIPYDTAFDAETLTLAYLDEAAGVWIPVPTTVDRARGVLIAEVTHFSWWNPFTWNYAQWAAGLDSFLNGRVVEFVTQLHQFVGGCTEQGTVGRVTNDANLAQGCIVRESPSEIVFRLQNPRSFPVDLYSASLGVEPPPVLGPGEGVEFRIGTDVPSPARVVASIPTMHLMLGMFFMDSALSAVPAAGAIEKAPKYWKDVEAIARTFESLILAAGIPADIDAGRYPQAVEKFFNVLSRNSTAEMIAKELQKRALLTVSPEDLAKAFTAMGASQAILRSMDYLINSALNEPNEIVFSWTQNASPTAIPVRPTMTPSATTATPRPPTTTRVPPTATPTSVIAPATPSPTPIPSTPPPTCLSWNSNPPSVPGDVIVTIVEGASPSSLWVQGVLSVEKVYEASEGPLSRSYLVRFDPCVGHQAALGRMRALPSVEHAELNTVYSTF